MQRTPLLIAIVAGLGLAGAIAYAANRGAIAPLSAQHASVAAMPMPISAGASASSAGPLDPVRSAAKPALPPTDAEVGDAASFGRNVRWLGTANGFAVIDIDCSAAHAEDPALQCQQLGDPAVNTPFAFADLARIELPAASANSMLCYWLTPFLQGYYGTQSASPVLGQIAYAPSIAIESPVLANPGMINPLTGTPFNGRITKGASYEIEQALVQQGWPAQVAFRQRSVTCSAALLSKQQLRDTYGLTRAQADQVFANPITLRFGVNGGVRNVYRASFGLGVRVVGD